MKKVCAVLLLTVCWVFALTAFAMAAEDVTGEWYADVNPGIDPNVPLVSGTLNLKKNKKFEFTATRGTESETEKGTWKYDKKKKAVFLTYSPSGLRETLHVFTVAGREILQNDRGMTFTRNKPFMPEKRVAAKNEKAFRGTWKVRCTEYNNMLHDPQPIYGDEGIWLDMREVRLEFSAGEVRVYVPFTKEPFDETIPVEFKDGALIMYFGETERNRYELTEEGNIYTTLYPATKETVYLEKVK